MNDCVFYEQERAQRSTKNLKVSACTVNQIESFACFRA